jgi:DNA-binding NarL/FixJ family response regulator
LLLEGLSIVIRNQPDMALVGQASNCRDAIQQFSKRRPDVTPMDLRLPDMSGIDGMVAIQAQFPDARIICYDDVSRGRTRGARPWGISAMKN